MAQLPTPREAEPWKEFVVVKFQPLCKGTKEKCIVAAWRLMDTNGDGRLTLAEFGVACRKIGFQGRANTVFKALDKDGSGIVTLQEIDWKASLLFEAEERAAAEKLQKEQEIKKKKAEKMVAGKGKQQVEPNNAVELCAFLVQATGKPYAFDPVKTLVNVWFTTLDSDLDGKLTKKEFAVPLRTVGLGDNLNSIYKEISGGAPILYAKQFFEKLCPNEPGAYQAYLDELERRKKADEEDLNRHGRNVAKMTQFDYKEERCVTTAAELKEFLMNKFGKRFENELSGVLNHVWFKLIDTDLDGKLTKKEFAVCLRTLGAGTKLNSLFKQLSSNGQVREKIL